MSTLRFVGKWAAILAGGWLLWAAAALLLLGCADKSLYRQAAESGWQRWQEDRRPVLPDDEYKALPQDQKHLYIPQGVIDAREFERREALKLLEDR